MVSLCVGTGMGAAAVLETAVVARPKLCTSFSATQSKIMLFPRRIFEYSIPASFSETYAAE